MADPLFNLPVSSSGVTAPNVILEPIPESQIEITVASPQATTSARPISSQAVLPPRDALGKFTKRAGSHSSSSSKSKNTVKSSSGRPPKVKKNHAVT